MNIEEYQQRCAQLLEEWDNEIKHLQERIIEYKNNPDKLYVVTGSMLFDACELLLAQQTLELEKNKKMWLDDEKGCECSYCKSGVDEYFCAKCTYNFNECECYWGYKDYHRDPVVISLCPKCHPRDFVFSVLDVKHHIYCARCNKVHSDCDCLHEELCDKCFNYNIACCCIGDDDGK